MDWFKRKNQESMTPEVFALFLLKTVHDNVKSTSKILKKHLDASEQLKLPKVEEELLYFYVFAYEYWWTTDSNRTQEARRVVREAFEIHLANIVNMDILQERLIAYAQIVNEKKSDNVKFLGFGMKLSGYCDMSNDPHLLALAPQLFTEPLMFLQTLSSVRLIKK